MGKPRLPGLLHGTRRVEVEDVRPRHRTACCVCGLAPARRRLKVQDGSGRAQTVRIFCAGCGVSWLGIRDQEVSRAIMRLQGADIACRIPDEPSLAPALLAPAPALLAPAPAPVEPSPAPAVRRVVRRIPRACALLTVHSA
jgi:hypothetical protein